MLAVQKEFTADELKDVPLPAALFAKRLIAVPAFVVLYLISPLLLYGVVGIIILFVLVQKFARPKSSAYPSPALLDSTNNFVYKGNPTTALSISGWGNYIGALPTIGQTWWLHAKRSHSGPHLWITTGGIIPGGSFFQKTFPVLPFDSIQHVQKKSDIFGRYAIILTTTNGKRHWLRFCSLYPGSFGIFMEQLLSHASPTVDAKVTAMIQDSWKRREKYRQYLASRAQKSEKKS